MKKNYIISFIIITVVLIASVITVGVVANVQLKNREDDKYYKVGEAKIFTIKEATNVKVDLVNYSYGSDGSTYTKYYEYEIQKAESVASIYTEYLSTDENFEISSDEAGVLTFKKNYEKQDLLTIVLKFEEDVLEISLSYTYN